MLRFNYLIITSGLFILVLLLIYQRKVKNKDYTYLTFFSIFFIYLMFVLKYTLFPIPFHNQQVYVINYNLIPFNLDPETRLLGREVLLNILLTIPFGFGISYVKKVNIKKVLLYGLCFGLCIESIQLFISYSINYAYRVFDINDIIFNFTGVVLGYTVFLAYSKVLLIIGGRIPFLKRTPLFSFLKVQSKGQVSSQKTKPITTTNQ